MEITGVGGGIMLAIAAALWLAYLLPNWFKRREYLATERNAVRLQQTIRVLAETAQAPDVVRAARSAPFPVAVGRPATPPPAVDPRVLTARRIRRTRALSTLVLASALILGFVQVSLIASTGATAGSWLVVGIASIAAVSSLAMLGRLAERSRSGATTAVRPARRTTLGARPQAVPQVDRSWTPVTMPKPLYLDKANAPAVVQHVDLQAAARLAEEARRAAEREAATIRPAAVVPANASRFARMGIVDDTDSAVPDLDAALARRRAAG
jgi:hypothetical protein